MSENALVRDFAVTARKLAEAGNLYRLRLAVVTLQTDKGRMALRVRAELEHASEPVATAVRHIKAGRIEAIILPLGLDSLESLWEEFRGGKLSLERKDDVLLSESRPNWTVFPGGGGVRVSADMAYATAPNVFTGRDEIAALDREIQQASSYRYANLSRLAKAFIGEPFDDPSPRIFELIAPWPVLSVEAENADGFIHASLVVTKGANLAPVILAVEDRGSEEDRRYASSNLAWKYGQEVDRDYVRLTTQVPGPPEPAERLHLYFQGLSHVSFSVPIRERSDEQIDLNARVISAQPAANVAPGKLRRIRVSGYRALEDASIDISDLDLVIGRNQTGKSTLLDAFRLASLASQRRLSDAISDRGGIQEVLWRGRNARASRIRFELGVEADGQHYDYAFELGGVGTFDYEVITESLHQQGTDAAPAREIFSANGSRVTVADRMIVKAAPRELALVDLDSVPEARLVLSALSRIMVFQFNAPAMRAPSRINPGAALAYDGANLAQVIYDLKSDIGNTAPWQTFLDTIRLAFDVDEIGTRPVSGRTIELTWRDSGSDQGFGAAAMSDGTLTFLGTVLALLSRDASLVAIDEPEQHVHPEAIWRIFGAAEKYSDIRPVLLTTHSERLLAMFDKRPESIVIARRAEGGVELIRPDSAVLKDWTKEFSLADLRPDIEAWEPK